MILLYVLALAAAAVAAYDYYSAGFRYSVSVDISEGGADIRVLYPFLRVAVNWTRSTPEARIYLFKMGVYRLRPKPGRKGKRKVSIMRLVRSVAFRDLTASAAYAMENPYLTGAVFAALNAAWVLIRPGDICLTPDFASEGAYAGIRAHVNVSLSHTMLNYMTRRPATWNKI